MSCPVGVHTSATTNLALAVDVVLDSIQHEVRSAGTLKDSTYVAWIKNQEFILGRLPRDSTDLDKPRVGR